MGVMCCEQPSETKALTGGFQSYLNYVYSIPMLSEEEEKSLFLRYQEENDLKAARTIVLSHLKYVAAIAKRYMGYGLPLEDLVQEGSIGLMKSVQRFDLSHGVRLSSFAIHWIRAEITEYIVCNWKLVKVATTKAQRKLFFKLRQLKRSIEKLDATAKQDIAESLDVEISDVVEMETRLRRNDLYFDESIGDNLSDDLTSRQAKSTVLKDQHSDPEKLIIDQDTHRHRVKALRHSVRTLDERSRDIIESRWLLNSGEKVSLKLLAEKYGISKERVRQIEVGALEKLSSLMDIEVANDFT